MKRIKVTFKQDWFGCFTPVLSDGELHFNSIPRVAFQKGEFVIGYGACEYEEGYPLFDLHVVEGNDKGIVHSINREHVDIVEAVDIEIVENSLDRLQ